MCVFFKIYVLSGCLNVGFVCFPSLILPLCNDLVLNFGMALQVKQKNLLNKYTHAPVVIIVLYFGDHKSLGCYYRAIYWKLD